MEAWQGQRIAEFVTLLPPRSVFYRKHLAAFSSHAVHVGSFASLEALPFTTKGLLREAQSQSGPGRQFGSNQGVPLGNIIQAVSSSGTTGDPMFYALTRRDLEVWSDGIANVFFTCGVCPRGRRCASGWIAHGGWRAALRGRTPPHRRHAGLARRLSDRADSESAA
jgi:phenylacetate-coenzyme A ligase PaaK-like adenylate-forming protein